MRIELKDYIKETNKILELIRRSLDPESLKSQLAKLEHDVENHSLWNNYQHASLVLKEKKTIENKLATYNKIASAFDDYVELSNIAIKENDIEFIHNIEQELKKLQEEAKKLQVECLFTSDVDVNDCFLDINAGAGGTESNDWASMMLRMYLRFAESMNFKTEVVYLLDGEEAGVKSASVKICGHNAYGWFKTESGVHRLVRNSPFNALGKRMTSFASAWIYPVINDNIQVVIEDKDIRIDTYRASGAGGQHVNTTDSAIRITHFPTKIVVQCQNDRSQHKNKAEAMRMLKAKIYELEQKKQNEIINNHNATKTDNSWGYHIRSYVLQPYQLVKDLRTNVETSDTKRVLDGDLEKFIYASLIHQNITF
ncbi:peptide chain release factor 2 [Orientia tsutsugamushi]|uniref:peptide chain release factor 2 n=1 Tax=Orientia tsutsugamushi TaxID=784 RepID=UPI000D645127|nr:peptide chain release factor 2 [Orientia tsutsugamushi]